MLDLPEGLDDPRLARLFEERSKADLHSPERAEAEAAILKLAPYLVGPDGRLMTPEIYERIRILLNKIEAEEAEQGKEAKP